MDALMGILCFPLAVLLLLFFGLSVPAQFVWGFIGAVWVVTFFYSFFGGEAAIAPLNHIIPDSQIEDGAVPSWFSGFAFVGFWGGVTVCGMAVLLSILSWRPTSDDPGMQAYYDYSQRAFTENNTWSPDPWVSGAQVWLLGIAAHVLWALAFHSYRKLRAGYENHLFFEERDDLRGVWYNESGDESHMFPEHRRSALWRFLFWAGDWFDSTRLGMWILKKRGITS